ncbi:MAG TPA: hypothetical protein VGK72_13280 [Chthoniobacterales bacterium]
MARRRARSDTPLDHKQQELARLEQNLRRQMEDLQRMIEDAPRVAEEISRREREELLQRASEGRERLDVSIALNDKRFSETIRSSPRRRRALRKERREGRLLFVVLVIALAVAVLWIATHLQL